jgi:esterase/lipase superfamily enzyme
MGVVMNARHQMLESPTMGRRVHLWTFGDRGRPLVVFPSAAGIAHEWQAGGMIDAVAPLIEAGRMKVYCPETNVSVTFRGEAPLDDRMRLHRQYEQFVLETLVPYIRRDSGHPHAQMTASGCSLGGMYSALFALKHPDVFAQALCLSGRYRVSTFGRGASSQELYFNDPLAFVPNLEGVHLDHVRRNTHLILVVGQGRFEDGCIPETLEMASVLRTKGIPHHLGLWGHDSRHDYTWWRRQARHYLGQLF